MGSDFYRDRLATQADVEGVCFVLDRSYSFGFRHLPVNPISDPSDVPDTLVRVLMVTLVDARHLKKDRGHLSLPSTTALADRQCI
jgi:hypothetical protein